MFGGTVRIACVGGGPAGLYFSVLMKLTDPASEVTVFERNKEGVTRYEQEITDPAELTAAADLVVAADGVNSQLRAARGGFGSPVSEGRNKYFSVGLGTTLALQDVITLAEELGEPVTPAGHSTRI